MRISVLSGKGGTGKTTVAVNMAFLLGNCRYMDCDVEEPNGFIFLKPRIEKRMQVEVMVPRINQKICSTCGKCAQFCYFNAIAHVNSRVVLFPGLCHGCEGCILVCPQGAIQRDKRVIGEIEVGYKGNIECIRGVLNVGEPMGVPIIRKLKEFAEEGRITILDCPPGSSCSVVNSIEDSDFALLVTEPTVFGLHDLEIAVQLVGKLGIPAGVVINRSGEQDRIIEEYCRDQGIPLLGRIPFDRDIARVYSRGELLADKEEFGGYFKEILANLKGVLPYEAGSNC